MPRGKKNPTSAASKTARKTAEPIKEKAAEPEKKAVKPTAEKKKATAPKKAAAKSSAKATEKTRTAKKTSTSVDVKAENVSVKATEKAVPKTVKKAATAKKKSAAPKRTVRKSANGKSDEVLIQSGSKDYTLSEITQICKDAYRGGTRKQIKNIKVYVKAEGNKLKAYYVVNDSVNGSVDL